jgi:hypothetical protein
MNIKQVIFINISFFISLTVLAADRPTQPVRTEVDRYLSTGLFSVQDEDQA